MRNDASLYQQKACKIALMKEIETKLKDKFWLKRKKTVKDIKMFLHRNRLNYAFLTEFTDTEIERILKKLQEIQYSGKISDEELQRTKQ